MCPKRAAVTSLPFRPSGRERQGARCADQAAGVRQALLFLIAANDRNGAYPAGCVGNDERLLWVDLSCSIAITRTAGIGRKRGVQDGQGEFGRLLATEIGGFIPPPDYA